MGDVPTNKPKDIKRGDIITASWLNQSKNSFQGVSATAPLFFSQTPFGTVINHGEHSPAVKWGSVVSDYVYSDASYVEVYPMYYTETSDGTITSNIISSAEKDIVKVYLTNPIKTVASDISDVTQHLSISQSDIISYMWFGNRCGTTLGGISSTDGIFPVKVTQTGGSAGNKTTQCSFTYTVETINDVQLATVQSPAKKRPSVGKMAAPASDSYGLAFYDEDGDLVLYDANETLAPNACT